MVSPCNSATGGGGRSAATKGDRPQTGHARTRAPTRDREINVEQLHPASSSDAPHLSIALGQPGSLRAINRAPERPDAVRQATAAERDLPVVVESDADD